MSGNEILDEYVEKATPFLLQLKDGLSLPEIKELCFLIELTLRLRNTDLYGLFTIINDAAKQKHLIAKNTPKDITYSTDEALKIALDAIRIKVYILFLYRNEEEVYYLNLMNRIDTVDEVTDSNEKQIIQNINSIFSKYITLEHDKGSVHPKKNDDYVMITSILLMSDPVHFNTIIEDIASQSGGKQTGGGMGSNISEATHLLVNINENNNEKLLTDLLKQLDSFHDFTTQRAGAKSNTVISALIEVVKSKNPSIDIGNTVDRESIRRILMGDTFGGVTTGSDNYEDKVISYFEKVLATNELFTATEPIILDMDTISSFFDKDNNYSLIEPTSNNILANLLDRTDNTQKNVVIMLNEGKRQTAHHNICVKLFTLLFFGDGDLSKKLYYTIDATPGLVKILDTVYGDYTNSCINIITQSNVGDSASTTTADNLANNKYIFTKNPIHAFDNNIFSIDDGVEFSYVLNEGRSFDRDNITQFQFVIKTATNEYRSSFNTSKTGQGMAFGPSVSYLSSLIGGGQGSADNCMKLDPQLTVGLKSENRTLYNKILFDVKRNGDYSQIESLIEIRDHLKEYNIDDNPDSVFVFGSGDRLATLYSRLRRVNTILKPGGQPYMNLHRFAPEKTKILTPDQINEQNVARMKKERFNELNRMYKDLLLTKSLYDELGNTAEAVKNHMSTMITGLTLLTIESNDPFSKIINDYYQKRVQDIKTYIETTVLSKLDGITFMNNNDIDATKARIFTYFRSELVTIDNLNITNNNENDYIDFILQRKAQPNQFLSLFKSFQLPHNGKEDNNKFFTLENPNSVNDLNLPVLRLNGDTYTNIIESLNSFLLAMNKMRTSTQLYNVLETKEYNLSMDAYYDTFFVKNKGLFQNDLRFDGSELTATNTNDHILTVYKRFDLKQTGGAPPKRVSKDDNGNQKGLFMDIINSISMQTTFLLQDQTPGSWVDFCMKEEYKDRIFSIFEDASDTWKIKNGNNDTSGMSSLLNELSASTEERGKVQTVLLLTFIENLIRNGKIKYVTTSTLREPKEGLFKDYIDKINIKGDLLLDTLTLAQFKEICISILAVLIQKTRGGTVKERIVKSAMLHRKKY